MAAVDAVAGFDGNLVRCALGRAVTNLRELLDGVRRAPDAAIEHHMMRCALEDRFEWCESPKQSGAANAVFSQGLLIRINANRLCRKENRSRQFDENRHVHEYFMMLLGIDHRAPNVLVA